MSTKLLYAEELAHILRQHNIPVVAEREGSLDVEHEVQVSNTLSVTHSWVDGSFGTFELLNDDPDNVRYEESKRFHNVPAMIKAVKVKLAKDEKRGREQRR